MKQPAKRFVDGLVRKTELDDEFLEDPADFDGSGGGVIFGTTCLAPSLHYLPRNEVSNW